MRVSKSIAWNLSSMFSIGVLLGVYFVGGAFYNFRMYNARGLDLIPHRGKSRTSLVYLLYSVNLCLDFWLDLPYLIKVCHGIGHKKRVCSHELVYTGSDVAHQGLRLVSPTWRRWLRSSITFLCSPRCSVCQINHIIRDLCLYTHRYTMLV